MFQFDILKDYCSFHLHFESGDIVDHLDIRLVELLQLNGRISLSELSKKLSLSRPSVAERLKRLQEKGIIEGFSARVAPTAVGRGVIAIVQLSELRVPHFEFERWIVKDTDIMECHRVTGTTSYYMKAAITGMDQLTALVDRLIPYGTVNTSIVLASPVTYRCMLPSETDAMFN